MKLSLGIHAIAERFGDFEAINMAKEAGFDAIDFSFHSSREREEALGDDYKKYAKKIRAHLNKVGIICNQAHAPYSINYNLEKGVFEQKYLGITRAMEAASILGAKNIVVHPIAVPDGVDFEEYNIRFYKSLIPYCEKFGINIAVENLFYLDPNRKRSSGKLGNPVELNRIVEKINSPKVVACIDIGHAAVNGYEPEEFIDGVNPNIIKALHVQDNNYMEDLHTLPYFGSLSWKEIMTSLKKAEYDGELTYETGKFIRKIPDELLPEALKFAALIGRHLISMYES